MATKIYTLPPFNPWTNLAIEDYMFRYYKALNHQQNNNRSENHNPEIIIVWQNPATVVIGAYQNPWQECMLNNMAHKGVTLVRRQSGGGAVFHDKGNINISFISSRSSYHAKNNLNLLTKALLSFGIQVSINKRNDLLIKDKKISGSAYKYSQHRVLHHCTLLTNSDLELMHYSLRTSSTNKPFPLNSKGITSVSSPVINLASIVSNKKEIPTVSTLAKALAAQVIPQTTPQQLAETIRAEERVSCKADEFQTWKWLFGKTPDFIFYPQKQFPGGKVSLEIGTHRCIINHVHLKIPETLKIRQIDPQHPVIGRPFSMETVLYTLEYYQKSLPNNSYNKITQFYDRFYDHVRSFF